MFLKIIIFILGLFNGGWMVFDGIHVLLKGKYFGPDKPGPWSNFITAIGIDPFKIGPIFIIIGGIWLIFTFSLLGNQQWTWLLGIIACIVTLWYLPVGTLISLIIFVLLILFKNMFIK